MSTNRFRVSIGAKRQLTLPAELLQQLQVPERGELMVEVIGDHAVITPMVSVPRAELPEELRRTFESRRGAHASDIPLAQFLKEAGHEKSTGKAAPRLSVEDRLASLTPNEKKALREQAGTVSRGAERRPMKLTKREMQVLEQLTGAPASTEIAHTLGLAEPTVKSNLSSIKRKLGKLLEPSLNEAGTASS